MARQYATGAGDTVRQYAKIIGIVLILVGVLGFFIGDEALGLNSDVLEDIIHIATGALLAFAGFQAELGLARNIVGGLGIVYLLVGVLSFVDPTIFGLIPHGYGMFDNILHLGLGVLNIVIAWFVGR
jgi:hypothetical protein